MKKQLKMVVIGACFAASLARNTTAATSAVKTNYDSTISFTLTAYTTGTSKPASITTKQVIQGLNGTTNSLGKTNQFSTAAKLVYRQILSGSNIIGSGQFVLDGSGTGTTATDVSELVSWIQGFTAPITNGTKVTKYSDDEFRVVPGAPALYLEGVSTTTTTTLSSSKATVLNSLKANVGGTGVAASGAASVTSVVNGTISFSGGKLE